ncbi:MAG: cupin domain-containing protein [Alphaproteobacteria bacterium]
MVLPVHKPTRAEIMKCVARFADIVPADGGLPDQEVEGYRRTFRNALGFSQPREGGGTYSPIGDEAKPKISHLSAGFNLGYVQADPGQGVMMHTHDTNETFVVVDGKWKFEWEGDKGNDYVVLNEWDIISFVPGPQRRFECVEAPKGMTRGMILGVIGGNTPAAEFSPEAVKAMRKLGVKVVQGATQKLKVTKPRRGDVLQCVARFDELYATDTGLPDQAMDGCHRIFRNAIGFAPPRNSDNPSPVGNAAKPRIGHLKPGFGAAYVTARPGQGTLMHNHDTNETFVVMDGTWEFFWEGDKGDDSIVLKPRDIISFPSGIQRCFKCVKAPKGKDMGTILGVIGGNSPYAEYSRRAIADMAKHGIIVKEAA